MKKSVTKRIFGFDTLRFVAITLIVIYHVFPGVLPGGFVAVESFFVLSGFLICQKLIRAKRKEGKNFGTAKSFINYFWNRLARFWPTLLYCMILTLTLAYFANPDLLTGARQNSL
jgi:peptidoglycan/LPS O-acetylase OafA/YrhL